MILAFLLLLRSFTHAATQLGFTHRRPAHIRGFFSFLLAALTQPRGSDSVFTAQGPTGSHLFHSRGPGSPRNSGRCRLCSPHCQSSCWGSPRWNLTTECEERVTATGLVLSYRSINQPTVKQQKQSKYLRFPTRNSCITQMSFKNKMDSSIKSFIHDSNHTQSTPCSCVWMQECMFDV